MGINESNLIKDLKKGKNEAFELIVKEYGNKVYNLIVKMISDREDARDLTQDVFIRVYNNIDFFRGESSFYTWIYSIAVNCSKDYWRKKKEYFSLDNIREISDGENKTESTAETNELRAIIFAEIYKLDTDHREAVILRDVMGFSYSEISEILGVSQGTVKSRISRGRYKLRSCLQSLNVYEGGNKDGS
ncbi:RNA polymerase sigma factor [Alkalibacter saccharofermentans]|uniref:RNA polymerase, sigma-24 subunit, RpoE n=1 Tax=Alkalibacter saccharofermentans DSM 14828 TaxID=1120975 RepID=A0A1M4X866_9FIRM|nr:sigma-70 family RNA polymerase sigma factor [Alkalibacter saccharofermentans]SHE89656.1 RNA polymerase, sigma-24 subunit, RpoE [Alkalibacter saccharofermentans DSM 14828]